MASGSELSSARAWGAHPKARDRPPRPDPRQGRRDTLLLQPGAAEELSELLALAVVNAESIGSKEDFA